MNFQEVINVLKNHKVAFADIPVSGMITIYEHDVENAYQLFFENDELSYVEVVQTTMVIKCDSIKAFTTVNAGITICLFNKDVFIGLFSASREI